MYFDNHSKYYRNENYITLKNEKNENKYYFIC